MDLSDVSRTRDIPRKWNVQTWKLNYLGLYNCRHRLEYRHVFGDVRAMKRRCCGDIHRWIGDVHGASAINPLIFGNSSAIIRGLPPSIGNHRRTFDLWKYRIFAKHRWILPYVSVTFTNASPNYRRTPPIIRLGTSMCDCKLTSCQYREQSRQIATFFIGRRRETSPTLMWLGHYALSQHRDRVNVTNVSTEYVKSEIMTVHKKITPKWTVIPRDKTVNHNVFLDLFVCL